MSDLKHKKRSEAPVQNKMDDAGASATRSFSPPAFQLQADAATASPEVAQRQEDPTVSETVTDAALEHNSLREGFDHQVYLDTNNLPTAGTGHLLVGSEITQYPVGSTVPQSVLEQWRIDDSTGAYDAARQQAALIGYESQDLVNALSAVSFQLGTAWTDIHTGTWAYLENQEWVNAAHEAADSGWFAQTPVRVADFQRVLLNIAGQPTDWDSLREFNQADIDARGVTWPTEANFNAFELGEATTPATDTSTAATSPASASPTTSEGSQSTTGTSAPTVAPVIAGISGSVGLDKDGSSYVGTSADIKKVQQQLINAGMLPAQALSSSGNMVSNADGILGARTIEAITNFQSQIMGFSKPDGRVDAGGKTWGKLASFTGTVAEPVNETSGDSGGNTTPETEVLPDNQPTQIEETPTNSSQTDEMETQGADVAGPTSVAANATFDDVPSSYADGFKITKSVGRSGSNNSTDVSKLRNMLQTIGYKTDLQNPTSSASTNAKKLKTQTANCIFHFQLLTPGLSTDARVDPNGGTWKAMVTAAYQSSGGQVMTSEQKTTLNETRKGTSGDVPSSINANVGNGHLLGIDNSGYLLPQEFRSGAETLKSALEEIKKAIGDFSISCGYRSPSHNVKIGSTATKSQHVQGIAADIQSNGTYGPQGIKTKILELIAQGKIPPGGVGKYS
ncbi:MAG TPA: hypothetical protein ENJ82_07500, partial [Bacteroidetes bacterium]|nr:hypothetical protein [Bacteroidota bacterium]